MANGLSASLIQYARGIAEPHVGELPDGELVARFAETGEAEAFATLVRRHGPMVLGVCRRVLGHEQDAEDVFQAVFLVLARKASKLRQREAVGPWLFGVARRLALRARQKGRKREKREASVLAATPGNFALEAITEPTDELTVREAQVVLDEELARLPERERGPLVLCYLEGLTRDEAAARLGCPLGTLKSRLERARAILEKRLARRGIGLSAILSTLLVTRDTTSALAPGLPAYTTAAAMAFATASSTQKAVSTRAAELAEAMLKSSLVSKFVIVMAVFLTLVACGIGVGLALSGFEVSNERTKPALRTLPAAGDRVATPIAPVPRLAHKLGEIAESIPPPREMKRASGVGPWHPHAELTGKQRMWTVHFSPDGSRIAAAGDEGKVRLWDVAEAKELPSLKTPKARAIRSVAFGKDETIAAGDIDGNILRWDLQNNKELEPADSLGAIASSLTFGADGQSLAWVRDSGVVERFAKSGKPVSLASRQKDVNCVAISANGQTVAWGMQDGSVKLWDTDDGKELGQFRSHSHTVWRIAFSADGRTVASADHFATLRVWDLATGQAKMEQPHCGVGPPHALAFSADGRVIALTGGGTPGVIFMYDLETNKKLPELRLKKGTVHALGFSPCGRFLAATGSEGTVTVWTSRPASPAGYK
jgi:RNA polymerase sigma factor (sigma-70 family)